ncbi:hypothetical protein ACOSQ4_021276 [Xanthoceras sorbifolium]
MSTSFFAGSVENVNDSASNLNPMSLDQKHSRWKRLARKGTVSPGGMALQPSSGKRTQDTSDSGLQTGGDFKRARESSVTLRLDASEKIVGLLDGLGSWQVEKQLMHEIICDYFREIFSSMCPSLAMMNLVLGSVRPHVTPSINGFLDAKFSGEEIRQALFQTVCQLFFSKNTGTLLVRSGCGVLRMSE